MTDSGFRRTVGHFSVSPLGDTRGPVGPGFPLSKRSAS